MFDNLTVEHWIDGLTATYFVDPVLKEIPFIYTFTKRILNCLGRKLEN